MKPSIKRITITVSCLLISVGLGVTGYRHHQSRQLALAKQQAEQARLATLNTAALDLPFIINEVDALGGADYQLNWKELVAIASVQTNNYPDQITTQQLADLAVRFKQADGQVASFETIVSELLQPVPVIPKTEDMTRRERKEQLANRQAIIEANTQFESLVQAYLEDLTYIGYTPDKLKPEAKEAQFINTIQAGAIENYYQYGILPSITIAQAILESNWGTSQLATEGKNLFGVKVGYGWTGETILMDTREFHQTWIQDEFRKYEDPAESLLDHGAFLVENPRYATAGVFKQKTYRYQAQALQDAGYSTDQDEEGNYVYAEKLGALIRQYNLQLIDHEVLHPEY